MDTAQEQRKKKVGPDVGGTTGGARSVFDQLGNSGLLAQVDARKVDAQEPSLLSAAADEQIATPIAEVEEEAPAAIVAAPDAEAQKKTATGDGAKSAAPAVIAPVAPATGTAAATDDKAAKTAAPAAIAPAKDAVVAPVVPVVAAADAKAAKTAAPAAETATGPDKKAAEEIAKVAPEVAPAVAPSVAPVVAPVVAPEVAVADKKEEETAKIVAPPAAEEAPKKAVAGAVATAIAPVVAPAVAPTAANQAPVVAAPAVASVVEQPVVVGPGVSSVGPTPVVEQPAAEADKLKPAADAEAEEQAKKAEQLSASELERVAVEEQQQAEIAANLTVQEDPAKAAAIAKATGIDPVLITDPKDLGSSELAKQKALGAEGEAALGRAMETAAASLGGGALDTAARDVVRQQVQEQLEVSDIVEARREGKLDALVEGALRTNALRSRDEVIFLLQQVAQDERTLQEILAGGDPASIVGGPHPGSIALGMIENVAMSLVELEDLYALAAYDHGDILKKVVLTDEALNVKRFLSPVALKMGGFASVLYQMVCDELTIHPLPIDPTAAGELDAGASSPSFKKNLLQLVTDLRLFRTATA